MNASIWTRDGGIRGNECRIAAPQNYIISSWREFDLHHLEQILILQRSVEAEFHTILSMFAFLYIEFSCCHSIFMKIVAQAIVFFSFQCISVYRGSENSHQSVSFITELMISILTLTSHKFG